MLATSDCNARGPLKSAGSFVSLPHMPIGKLAALKPTLTLKPYHIDTCPYPYPKPYPKDTCPFGNLAVRKPTLTLNPTPRTLVHW
jgi:hypothetical protein